MALEHRCTDTTETVLAKAHLGVFGFAKPFKLLRVLYSVDEYGFNFLCFRCIATCEFRAEQAPAVCS